MGFPESPNRGLERSALALHPQERSEDAQLPSIGQRIVRRAHTVLTGTLGFIALKHNSEHMSEGGGPGTFVGGHVHIY